MGTGGGAHCLVLLAVLVAVKGFTLVSSDYKPYPQHDEANLYFEDWQNLRTHFDTETLHENSDTSFYDIRSNETGSFNGSAFGNWNRFRYSLWKVAGKNASVSAYTIEKFNVTSHNITLIVPTYYNVELTGDMSKAQWTKEINSKLLQMNTTLITLSTTKGSGTGQLEFKSSESGQISENETLHCTFKDRDVSTTWDVQRNGLINSYDKYTNFLIFESGKGQNQNNDKDVVPSHKTLSMDKFLDKIFQWSEQHSKWNSKVTGFIMGKDKVKRLNSSIEDHYDLPNQSFSLFRNSSGYIWNNVHSLHMEFPEAFNKVLPDFFELFF
ncbi:uncharacterized protein [Palaemon carinicauda]|uniref:uncharacterized protein n=1 Tax=Palaemon carinicauda TaxID=392227 RepID=UPI0035B5EA99